MYCKNKRFEETTQLMNYFCKEKKKRKKESKTNLSYISSLDHKVQSLDQVLSWELVKNANSWVPPYVYLIRTWGGVQQTKF